MKLLILGGTRFVGRHLVDAALSRGHEVTLFNRGQTNPDLYPQLEHLQGDRDGGMQALEGGSWDAVIDTCGYVPRLVKASAELLASAVEHYVFISSISVFADFSQVGMREDAPLGRMKDESIEEITEETYGPLKVLCEQAVEAAIPGRALIVRPGLIVGPHDHTDRFTYWPQRIAQSGETLAPDDPKTPVQFIDARDLAEWTLRMVADKHTGIYNTTGPKNRLSMGELLETSLKVTGSEATLTWVEAQFLLDQGLEDWSDLPVWVHEQESVGVMQVECSKAIAAGLSFCPLADTIRDTSAWADTRSDDYEWQAGLTRQKEAEVLKARRGRAK
ncbi:MAG: SDR family oxidoreductase [Chloroflexi bacterium]|nr:SDR family oxidoreductase [Chloroflexota bacterium]